jgi:hypothetical protein
VPWVQRLAGKYVLLPWCCLRLSWERAPALFERQARALVAPTSVHSPAALTARVLVPPQIGLEDSSRFASYAMVLEHLTIVGDRVTEIVFELTRGRRPAGRVSTADLKARGALTAEEAVAAYRAMVARFRERAVEQAGDRASPLRYDHPWFGPLDAYRWLCFAPFHQAIHLEQSRRILARLPAAGVTAPRSGA